MRSVFAIAGCVSIVACNGADRVIAEEPASECSAPSYYIDEDGDGFGAGSAVCPTLGAGPYAARAGDCNDHDSRAFPGTTAFYSSPYRLADGGLSFDYDCSGAEEQNPGPAYEISSGPCTELAPGGCSGGGYLPDPARTGLTNPFCGSTYGRGCLPGPSGCTETSRVLPAITCH
jgi:hypothetical protein